MSVYAAGLPMHSAGLGMTIASNTILPAGIPLSVAFLLTLSNAGQIDAAGTQWQDVAKKLDGFKDELEKIKKLPEADWTGDDRRAFDLAVTKYESELKKLKDSVDMIGTVMHGAALVYFLLDILVLAVGIILLYMAVVAWAYMCVPFGQAVAVSFNAAVAAKVAAILPTIATFKAGVTVVAAFLGTIAAVVGGTYGMSFVNLGVGEPDFTQASVEMPEAPG
ncbi:WXG100 family type VII secretion target [Actinomadura macra]|uniref:WXG100 family type VII secretion target n=1 Tax=Actinomadura macra TaxID=46164 RepID=UPI00082A6EE6|nr:hypothetical protein [Actinomadura macra]